MEATNIVIKTPGSLDEVRVKCPQCEHENCFRVYHEGKLAGEDEDECHNCKAILTYHWER